MRALRVSLVFLLIVATNALAHELAVEQAKDNVGSVNIGVVARDKLVWTKNYSWAESP